MGKYKTTVGNAGLEFPQDDDAEYVPVTTRSGLRTRTGTLDMSVPSPRDEKEGSLADDDYGKDGTRQNVDRKKTRLTPSRRGSSLQYQRTNGD